VPFLGESRDAGDSGDDTAVSCDWTCEPGGSTLIRSESEAASSLTSTCALLKVLRETSVQVREACASYTPATLGDSSNAIVTEAVSEVGRENNLGASSSSACNLDHGVVPSLFDLLLLS
jgi:hypothetical protein